MSIEGANHHLGQVNEGLEEMIAALAKAGEAFGSAYHKTNQAQSLIEKDIPPLLERALDIELQTALYCFTR
jgi:hypothetical protein